MKFREHRGLLIDSMATCIELPPTREALIAHIRTIFEAWPTAPDPVNIQVQLYVNRPDERIGWQRTYIVGLPGYGVVGFSDEMPDA